METGFLHLHKTLGYLVFFITLVNLVVVLTKGRTDARAARLLELLHNMGLLMAGRLNLLIGIAVLFLLSHSPTTWWAWAGLVLWVPVEIVSKRLVKPEIALVKDGGSGSGQLVMGAVIELVVVVTIFGLMSARP